MILWKFLFVAVQPAFAWADMRHMGQIVCHGFGTDLSMTAYLMAPVVLWMLAEAWVRSERVMARILNGYLWFVAGAVAVTMVVDSVLYPYWQIRLDATPVFYFTTSPGAALASMAWYLEVAALLLTAALCWALHWLLHTVQRKIAVRVNASVKARVTQTVSFLLIGGAMIIPIRGGVTVSTMSPGQAYFSSDMRLNHAAINPMFNFLYSISRVDNLAEAFHYMDDAKAQALMAPLAKPIAPADSATLSLSVKRPDIYLVILESFSSELMPSLGGEPIATRLDSIAATGALFTNFYAESFRTDRALAVILSGYPALPTTSALRYPNKFANMPSLARVLRNAGYGTYYYYGGDANFTNMKAYLVATGFDNIVSDTDFPVSERLSKWGAHDDVLFRRVAEDSRRSPFLAVVQTSSSHEPFEVPYQSAHKDERANAFAYADSCLGAFVDSLRASGTWERSIVVIVPDHWGCYPKGLKDHERRHRIPLVLTGGALRGVPARLDVLGSQSAITPTLLSMMGLDTSSFFRPVSLLDTAATHRAWLAEPEWFTLKTERGQTDGTVADKTVTGAQPDLTKAYIQTIYTDLNKR